MGEPKDCGSIFIKYLDKHQVLYYLWRGAKQAKQFTYCADACPALTLTQARVDIANMIKNKRALDLNTYYGKTMLIDITGDYFDPFLYNTRNGYNQAQKIINKLKRRELQKALVAYLVTF